MFRWPRPTNGATSRLARPKSTPNGTAWCSTAAWPKLPGSTCAKARRFMWKAASAPANGPTSKAGKTATAPRFAWTRCRCWVAAKAWAALAEMTTATARPAAAMRPVLQPLPPRRATHQLHLRLRTAGLAISTTIFHSEATAQRSRQANKKRTPWGAFFHGNRHKQQPFMVVYANSPHLCSHITAEEYAVSDPDKFCRGGST